ncbi:hypothetical protein SDC9_148206 [bioreactor metagenome]|uniref:Uncharacterized protein n=1 Tax=bioreactor metagenome TaxID=1076179 RepID=A0A645EGY3_9ZZZZ
MRVGQQNRVDFGRQFGQGGVLVEVPALLHAVVNENVLAADVEMRATAGDFMIRADKRKFHALAFHVLIYFLLFFLRKE